MIDIAKVRELQKENFDLRMENDKKIKISNFDSRIEKQKKLFNEVELIREKAEKEFPTCLREVEARIKQAINNEQNFYIFYYSYDYKDTFLVRMLLEVLPLSGFVCRFADHNKLEITW
jgi:hypothetical protein